MKKWIPAFFQDCELNLQYYFFLFFSFVVVLSQFIRAKNSTQYFFVKLWFLFHFAFHNFCDVLVFLWLQYSEISFKPPHQKNFFFKHFLSYLPYLATCIFLNFQIEPDWGQESILAWHLTPFLQHSHKNTERNTNSTLFMNIMEILDILN